MRGGVVVIVAAVFLLAACGGRSRLSSGAYRAQLVKIKQQSNTAEGQVVLGLRAKTIAELRRSPTSSTASPTPRARTSSATQSPS